MIDFLDDVILSSTLGLTYMARPRTNDPSNLPEQPNPTSDPVKMNELIGEYLNRLKYVTESYAVSQKLFKDDETLNNSLECLRRGLKRTQILKRRGERLHPEIESVVSYYSEVIC